VKAKLFFPNNVTLFCSIHSANTDWYLPGKGPVLPQKFDKERSQKQPFLLRNLDGKKQKRESKQTNEQDKVRSDEL
jgi:hypothetical protein